MSTTKNRSPENKLYQVFLAKNIKTFRTLDPTIKIQHCDPLCLFHNVTLPPEMSRMDSSRDFDNFAA